MNRFFLILALVSAPVFAGPLDKMFKEMSKAIAEDIDKPTKAENNRGPSASPTIPARNGNAKGSCGDSDIHVGQTLSWTLTPQAVVRFRSGKFGYGLVNIGKPESRACMRQASGDECIEINSGYQISSMNVRELKEARYRDIGLLYAEGFPYEKLAKFLEQYKEDEFVSQDIGRPKNSPPPVRFSTTVRWVASGNNGTTCTVVATFAGFDEQSSKIMNEKAGEADTNEQARQQANGKLINDMIQKHAKTVRVPAGLLASKMAVQWGGSLGAELILFIDSVQSNSRSKAIYEMDGQNLIMRHRIADPVTRKSVNIVYVFVSQGNEAVLGRMVVDDTEVSMQDIPQVFSQIVAAMKNG